MTTLRILGGDLGGTKTLLALAELHDGRLQIVQEKRYDSQAAVTFDDILSDFLASFPANSLALDSACLGIAGPTNGRQASLTYLPWQLCSQTLAARFRIKAVRLVNDFAAAANGLSLLDTEQLHTLQGGTPESTAPRLILGAGTGLGVAGVIRDGQHDRIVAGEGGHIGFAPQTPEQLELSASLLAQSGRVTAEDLLSGAGLARIYAFCGGRPRPAAEIGPMAITNTDPLARRAVELWLSIYGAVAGDFALHWLARGGVYIAGGMAAKLLPHFPPHYFLDAFNAKREHQSIVADMPVHLVTEERLGLLGSLALAGAQTS